MNAASKAISCLRSALDDPCRMRLLSMSAGGRDGCVRKIAAFLFSDSAFDEAFRFYMTHIGERLPMFVLLGDYFALLTKRYPTTQCFAEARQYLCEVADKIQDCVEERFNENIMLCLSGATRRHRCWMRKPEREYKNWAIEHGLYYFLLGLDEICGENEEKERKNQNED